MRILFIAPQPFYEERGTLIAIDLLLRALNERGDKETTSIIPRFRVCMENP